MAPDESGELFAKSLDGQSDALNGLIGHYRPFLVKMAREKLDSAVSPRLDASDVVQQTCLELYRDFSKFRGTEESQFVAWLKQILQHNVANAVRDHVHAQKRTTDKERRLGGAGSTTGKVAPQLAAQQSTPSVRAMRSEECEKMMKGLDQLPDDQREAVRLRHLEGLSLQQLAEHFGRSEVAVAGLLKRGMKRLSSQLAEDEES